MRIEQYTREFVDGQYHVIGGSTFDEEFYNYSEYEPIKMSLSKGSFRMAYPPNEPIYDNFEELIKLAKVTSEGVMDDDEDTFTPNYAEIMRGNHPDWHLTGFDVSVGKISLNFGNYRSGEVGWVEIVGAPRLWLTFETPRTRLGFDSKYNVYIAYDNGKHVRTIVEEDQGYLCRLLEFRTREPADGDNHESLQEYVEITECAGV